MVGLCRLCASLRKMDALVSIKDECSEICEKLRKCCQLNIKMQDALPKSICQECIENLNKSHKFYTKVTEAQETLKALYPDSQEESVQPSLVETLSAVKENSTKRSTSVLERDKVETTSGNQKKENPEIPAKQIKLEKCLAVKTNNSLNEFQNDKGETKTIKLRENFIQDVCKMLDMTKEEAMLESSYEIIETIEENDVEDLTEEGTEKYFNYQSVCEQQEEHHVVEEIAAKNPIDVLNDIELQAAEINEKPDDIVVPDNGLNIEFEYMDDYEDEEDDDDIVSNVDITQSINDGQLVKHTLPQQLDSWKHYKYVCFICDSNFSNFMQLYCHFTQEHKKTQQDMLQYKCYVCQKIIPRYNFFLNHIRSKHHPNLKLRCEVCDLSCQTFEELAHHRSIKCKEASKNVHIVPCNQCFKSFHNAYGLQKHYKIQHTSVKGRLKYQCMECNKEFQYKSCLKVHEQVHRDKNTYRCSFCDRTFAHKKNLELHLYVHVDENLYKCNICNKSFKTYLILDQHQVIHSEEKPFKCEFCDKNFRKKIQKIAHERTHTGEMPFTCGQCDKRFRFLSALNAHIKIHTGAKPYSCEYCDKTFADSSNRNKHIKRKHANGT